MLPAGCAHPELPSRTKQAWRFCLKASSRPCCWCCVLRTDVRNHRLGMAMSTWLHEGWLQRYVRWLHIPTRSRPGRRMPSLSLRWEWPGQVASGSPEPPVYFTEAGTVPQLTASPTAAPASFPVLVLGMCWTVHHHPYHCRYDYHDR